MLHVGKEIEEEILPFEKQHLHRAFQRPVAGHQQTPLSRGWFFEANSPPYVLGALRVLAQWESLPAHLMSGSGDMASPPQ